MRYIKDDFYLFLLSYGIDEAELALTDDGGVFPSSALSWSSRFVTLRGGGKVKSISRKMMRIKTQSTGSSCPDARSSVKVAQDLLLFYSPST